MLGSITAVLPIFLLILTGFFAKRCFLPSADFWRSAEALTGGLLNFANIKISGFIYSYMDILGGAASPLSLLAVGASLQLKMKAQQKYAISLAICLKLFLMPVITLAFISVFGLKGPAVAVAILYSTLPCEGNSYILARQMGGETDSMASIITFSTLASMFTCPVFLVLG